MENSFTISENKLCSPLEYGVHIIPSFHKPFTVETNASAYAGAAVLSQNNESGKSHPILLPAVQWTKQN